MVPRDFLLCSPGQSRVRPHSCGHAILHGKTDFVDVIKVQDKLPLSPLKGHNLDGSKLGAL